MTGETCSGTLNNLCQDVGGCAMGVAAVVQSYTPSAPQASVTDFVARWLEGPCHSPHPTDVSWEALLDAFSRDPRRAALDAVWRASVTSLAAWHANWLALMRAADFWDIPCLYWHMVYLCHERVDVLTQLAAT